MVDIRRLDIYRKVPKDLTQPTTSGACISVVCVMFISFMLINDLLAFLSVDIHSELFVDDPGREGRVQVHINVSLLHLACDHIGIDIQDENGRHEVGYVQNTEKTPLPETNGCRFEAVFEINKVPGNFHLSTHSAQVPAGVQIDMRHVVHSLRFGDDIVSMGRLGTHGAGLGSFDPLRGRDASSGQAQSTHEYILKVVPSLYERLGDWRNLLHGYQYTYAHKEYVGYHHSGRVIPAVWFRYELQPITVKYTERRQAFYIFLTSICAVVGGTFTVAGIIDSMLWLFKRKCD